MRTFSFGKFKGYGIDEVPSSYILYCLDNRIGYGTDFYEELLTELWERFPIDKPTLSNPNIKQAYKEVCKKYHPDKGGTNEAMQAINEFYELINK